jgi:hypothetical protein
VKVLGERGGSLFVAEELLPPGSWVVSEGRAGLADNDPVTMKKDTMPQSAGKGVPKPGTSIATRAKGAK